MAPSLFLGVTSGIADVKATCFLFDSWYGHEMIVGDSLAGEKIYRKFYTKEKEQLNGVLAICVCKPDSQPYFILCDIISVSFFYFLILFFLIVSSCLNGHT